jgi:hypothetical protein
LHWSFEVGLGVQILLKLIAQHSILLYNFFLEIWNHHHPSPSPCFPTPAPCSRHKDFLSQKSIANPGATISTLGDILTNPYEVGRQLQRLDPKTRLQKHSSILDLFPQPTINTDLNLVQSSLAHPHHPSIHPSIMPKLQWKIPRHLYTSFIHPLTTLTLVWLKSQKTHFECFFKIKKIVMDHFFSFPWSFYC